MNTAVQTKRRNTQKGTSIGEMFIGEDLNVMVKKEVEGQITHYLRNSSLVHRQQVLKEEVMKRIEDLHSRAVRKSISEKQELLREIEQLKNEIVNLSLDSELSDQMEDLDKKVKQDVKNLKSQLTRKANQINELASRLDQNAIQLNKYKNKLKEIEKKSVITLDVNCSHRKAKVNVGLAHQQFPDLMALLGAGLNVYMAGPSGSGKTTAARQCAKALDLPFYFTGAISSEFKLTGFMNAKGEYVTTEFRKAYENGGLFLFDEIDGSYPQAILAFNAALANGHMDFPDGTVKRHKDFYCIAAANTYGLGADRVYVGRNQLDAASLDRFAFVDWQYDEKLEKEMSGNDRWVNYVQDVRRVIKELQIRHIVSPRASQQGANLLKSGVKVKAVKEALIWKGLDQSDVSKIESNLCVTFMR